MKEDIQQEGSDSCLRDGRKGKARSEGSVRRLLVESAGVGGVRTDSPGK